MGWGGGGGGREREREPERVWKEGKKGRETIRYCYNRGNSMNVLYK